jgi:DNA polymerase I-like protein with 3'-5' exonuclease and polymerase domains
MLFDLESNGLLDELDTVHVLVIKEGGKRHTFRKNSLEDTIGQGLQMLQQADRMVAHNAIKFDVAAIKKVYDIALDPSKVYDTLVVSRLIFADIGDRDSKLVAAGILPGKLFKSHSLAAWGYRLKCHKGDYEGGWAAWNQAMEDYCEQDVEVLEQLYNLLVSKNYSQRAVDLEHQVAWIMAAQERHGFVFDERAAVKLYSELVQIRMNAEVKLKEVFGPLYLPDGKPFSPKRDNKKSGYVAGAVVQKVVLTEFNPGSRDHISRWLKVMRGWKPTVFTNDGKPKVDEDVLKLLPYPESKLLVEYLTIQKRIGQLAEGDQAWLKHVRKGRIHGSVITNGAVTGRATHAYPNIAQVPSVKKNKEGNILMGLAGGFGHESRALFTVPKGHILVGADLSGIELRCLAHYMAPWDKGAYAKVILEGDIHSENQKAAGLPTRNDAKTFIYAFLYGAGNAKIGSIIGKGAHAGGMLKQKFLSGLPALDKLIKAIQKASARGYLVGLDGRHLHCRSAHSALNTLLQSAGALISKQALIEFDRLIQEAGWQDRVHLVAWVHDEIQVEVQGDEKFAEEIGQMAVRAFGLAGEVFKFAMRIDGEYHCGATWAETH